MFKKSIFSLVLMLATAFALAFDWNTPEVNSRLWKVSKRGAPDSYLLGTYHLGERDSRLPPQIQNILANSEVLITEVMLPGATAESAADMKAAQQQMFNRQDKQTLSDQIGRQRVERLAKRLRAQGGSRLSVRQLNQFEPWAAVMLDMSIRPKGLSSDTGVDRLLQQQALRQKIALDSLERYVDLPDSFRTLSLARVEELLDFNDVHHDQSEALSRKLFQLYYSKNYPELRALSADSSAYSVGLPQESIDFWQHWLERELLVARNGRWMPKLLAELPKKRALVAVGFGHLVDDSGLIAQLRKHGYTVEAVQE